VEKPIPKDNEILIRILTVVVATEDPLVRKGKPYFERVLFGFTKPKKPIQGAFVIKTPNITNEEAAPVGSALTA
jgi:NADPH:quinone reductase-like Zn-dependent oxidoreductase